MFKFLLTLLLISRTTAYPAHNVNSYKEALKLSLLFYEAQRSGKLPTSNRIHWRGDSGLNDKGHNGEDLTGGYYDAADFVKFGITIAYTITMLSWGVITYEDAYRKTGQYQTTLEAIKWGTDYLVKCHVAPDEFYAQVGDFKSDHKFWGRPEELNMTRPSYKIDKKRPGSDVAGEAAAALAAASISFYKMDRNYSEVLLEHSKQLFNLAYKYQGLYFDAYPSTKPYLENYDYGDELAWAAVWIFKATGDVIYLKMAQNLYENFNLRTKPRTFFYNSKSAAVQVLLAQETQLNEYIENVKDFCNYALHVELRTPKGLLYIEKNGTLAHAANVALICLQAKDLMVYGDEYVAFARQQAEYILGSTGFSYLVGYSSSYPLQPHHAASSCKDLPTPCGWDDYKSSKPNPQVLYGALVSGPSQNDYYEDIREEFLYNEVTIDYNAGFQGLLAGLIQHDST